MSYYDIVIRVLLSVGVGEEYDNMYSTVCALGDMIPVLYCAAQLLEMVYLVHTLILCRRSHLIILQKSLCSSTGS